MENKINSFSDINMFIQSVSVKKKYGLEEWSADAVEEISDIMSMAITITGVPD